LQNYSNFYRLPSTILPSYETATNIHVYRTHITHTRTQIHTHNTHTHTRTEILYCRSYNLQTNHILTTCQTIERHAPSSFISIQNNRTSYSIHL